MYEGKVHLEGIKGNVGIAALIFNLGTRWEGVTNFIPWPLYPQGKNPQYPWNRKLGGPQSWSGPFGEEKIPLHPSWNQNTSHPAHNRDSIPSTLPRFLIPEYIIFPWSNLLCKTFRVK